MGSRILSRSDDTALFICLVVDGTNMTGSTRFAVPWCMGYAPISSKKPGECAPVTGGEVFPSGEGGIGQCFWSRERRGSKVRVCYIAGQCLTSINALVARYLVVQKSPRYLPRVPKRTVHNKEGLFFSVDCLVAKHGGKGWVGSARHINRVFFVFCSRLPKNSVLIQAEQ